MKPEDPPHLHPFARWGGRQEVEWQEFREEISQRRLALTRRPGRRARRSITGNGLGAPTTPSTGRHLRGRGSSPRSSKLAKRGFRHTFLPARPTSGAPRGEHYSSTAVRERETAREAHPAEIRRALAAGQARMAGAGDRRATTSSSLVRTLLRKAILEQSAAPGPARAEIEREPR